MWLRGSVTGVVDDTGRCRPHRSATSVARWRVPTQSDLARCCMTAAWPWRVAIALRMDANGCMTAARTWHVAVWLQHCAWINGTAWRPRRTTIWLTRWHDSTSDGLLVGMDRRARQRRATRTIGPALRLGRARPAICIGFQSAALLLAAAEATVRRRARKDGPDQLQGRTGTRRAPRWRMQRKTRLDGLMAQAAELDDAWLRKYRLPGERAWMADAL